MKTFKRPRQGYIGRSRCQNHGNDEAFSPIEFVKKGYDLPALPRTNTVLTNKNSRRFYCFNLLSDFVVPKDPRFNIRLVQPRPDILFGKLLRNLLNGWLVFVVVAEEDIKVFRFGVLSVHTEAIL